MNKDKYKYLEKINDKEAIKFYHSESKKTSSFLKDEKYDFLKQQISKSLRISRRMLPIITKEYKFWKEFSVEDQYAKVYSQYKNQNPKIIIDPNKLKNEEFSSYYPSHNGELVAYLTEESGLEKFHCYLINVGGTKIKDNLNDLYSFLCWDNKDIGFYYIKKIYISGDISNYTSYRYEVYYHKVGDTQSKDKKFLNEDEEEFDNKAFLYMDISDDGRYIILENDDSDDCFIIIKNTTLNKILKVYRYKNYIMYMKIINDKLYIYTNKDHEFGEIKIIDIIKDLEDKSKIKTLIKPEKYLLDNYYFAKDYIYCMYQKDVSHFIRIFDYQGNKIKDINFDTKGSAYISGYKRNNDVYIYFSSFTYPHTIYKYLFKKNKLVQIYQSKVDKDFDKGKYALRYELVKSKDGTKVPITIVYNKNNNLTKVSPTMLTTYGGFGMTTLPYYEPEILPFLNNGGIYILASVRGGGEFGKEWYLSAKGAKNKIKTFEDFIAVSEYLIDKKYTDNENLIIQGISHGGLIVTNAMLTKSELYKAVIAEVPVVDLINSYKDGIGSLLMDEYGDPRKKEDLKYILKWSPYQNIKKGMQYPDILITGATNDTRVGLVQVLKFANKMKDCSLGKTFLCVESDTGHYGFSDIDAQIKKQNMIFTFIYKVLNSV
ncbi:MAG: prolyl oligopeptidase family serine peptidase [Patescibacteria group bacterium]